MHNNFERTERSAESKTGSTNSNLHNQIHGDMRLNSTTQSASGVANKEDALFGNPTGFTFAKVDDIYKLPANQAKIVEQMQSVINNKDHQGNCVIGTEYGGAVGYGLDGKLHGTRVYSSHVEVGDNKESPNFGKEMLDLGMQGALVKETWQAKPNVMGKDDPDTFSKQDMDRADVLGLKSYVLTPANIVLQYEGDAQHARKDSDRGTEVFGMFDDEGKFWKYRGR